MFLLFSLVFFDSLSARFQMGALDRVYARSSARLGWARGCVRTAECMARLGARLWLIYRNVNRCRENPSLCADRETKPPGFWTRRI